MRHDLLIDPARYPQMPLTFEPNGQQRRCLTVLCAWQAPHNMRHYVTKAGIEPSGTDGITLAVRQPWSTCDMDELTRLVIAAHQWRVRIQVSGRARNILGVHLHARQADGDLFTRHPGPSRFDNLADLVGPTGPARLDKGTQ